MYNRSSAGNRQTDYESRARLPTSGIKSRRRDQSHKNCAKQTKTGMSFGREKCHLCGQRNHASKE